MQNTIKNTDDLLSYLVQLAESGNKQWFGFHQQKITGISLVHQIAANHADKMSPDEIVEYVKNLNDCIYNTLIRKE
jgi:hypothetical protein